MNADGNELRALRSRIVKLKRLASHLAVSQSAARFIGAVSGFLSK
jgi:hypothetical protein